jgi:hypothetical protein
LSVKAGIQTMQNEYLDLGFEEDEIGSTLKIFFGGEISRFVSDYLAGFTTLYVADKDKGGLVNIITKILTSIGYKTQDGNFFNLHGQLIDYPIPLIIQISKNGELYASHHGYGTTKNELGLFLKVDGKISLEHSSYLNMSSDHNFLENIYPYFQQGMKDNSQTFFETDYGLLALYNQNFFLEV